MHVQANLNIMLHNNFYNYRLHCCKIRSLIKGVYGRIANGGTSKEPEKNTKNMCLAIILHLGKKDHGRTKVWIRVGWGVREVWAEQSD